MEQQTKSKIVIDNGSETCKVGFSGEDSPQQISTAAFVQSQNLETNSPIKNGIVKDWDNMIKVWHHIFHKELKVNPCEHPCLMTEPIQKENEKKYRQKMTQIVFQNFGVPQFYLARQPNLSLYSTGKTTGLVFDCGDQLTQIVPIYDGYFLPHAVKTYEFGGRNLDTFMKTLLNQIQQKSLTVSLKTAKCVKEGFSHVAIDFDYKIKNLSEKKFLALPDGQKIFVGASAFRCPQLMFNPLKLKIETQFPGTHESIHQCIQKCEMDLRKEFIQNIILSGGSTMFLGTEQRLKKQLQKICQPEFSKINVPHIENRKYLPWIGGSIMSSLSTAHSMWISKSQYEDTGPQIIHQKCF